MDALVRVGPRRLDWLSQQVGEWVQDGLVSPEQAMQISSRYAASSRVTLARLVLGLGGVFVGVGLVWAVASNYDQLSPWTRVLLVSLVGLAVSASAEVVRNHALAGALRVVSVGAFGALVFQAAQTLQVPAYESDLVGWWALGAMTYAYAVAGRAALVASVGVAALWWVWHVAEVSGSPTGAAAALLLAGALSASVAVLHQAGWRQAFAGAWRVVGTLLALSGIFVAALPIDDDMSWTWWFLVGAVVVLAAAVGATWVTGSVGRSPSSSPAGGPALWQFGEVWVPVALVVAGVGVSLWDPVGQESAMAGDTAGLSSAAYLRSVLSVLGFLAAAGWLAVVGVLREAPALTWLAAAGLVVFTTFQSFAVFAPIVSGAVLFLAVGVVLLVTGVLVDRGRRALTSSLAGGA